MNSTIIDYRLHNLKTNEILGPFKAQESLFQAIVDLNLVDPEFIVSQQETTTELFDHKQPLDAWIFKKKKKPDIETEAMDKPKPIIIQAEVLR